MKSLVRGWTWMREMTVLAEDERARQDHPAIDSEHLFLALVSSAGPVAHAFRAAGVTLPEARDALALLHAERLAALGVRLPALTARNAPIPPPIGRGIRLTDRAERMLEAATRAPDHPDLGLLDNLRADQATDVDPVLHRLGVDPVALDGAARAYAQNPEPTPDLGPEPASQHHTTIPVPADRVWGLVAEPSHWLEWNASEFASATVLPDGIIEAVPRTVRRGRSPQRISHYRETRREPGRLLEWQRTGPRSAWRWTLQLVLAPRDGATALTLTYRYHPPALRRWLARVVLPIATRTGGFYLRTKAEDISRALR